MPALRDMRISRHFVLGDLLVDQTFPELAALLEPPQRVVENLKRLTTLLDSIADQFPPGLEVLSGFRDTRLNDACRQVGLPASVDSQHLYGCAADVKLKDRELDPEIVYEWMKSCADQIRLHEAVFYPLKGFIHVAVDNPEHPTPKRILMRT
jgi:uncharacterized protein YcbK (DUF882 family)